MSNYINASRIYERINSNKLKQENTYINSFNLSDRFELLRPLLHSIDEKALQIGVRDYLFINSKETLNTLNKFGLDLSSLQKEISMIYNKFPKSLINDIFNIKYKELSEIIFKNQDDTNKIRYKILEQASEPLLKVISENNLFNSFILTRSFVKNLIFKLLFLQEKDLDEYDKIMDDLNSNKNDLSSGELLSQIMQNKFSDKIDSISKTTDLDFINKINQLVNKEKQEEIFRDIPDNSNGLKKYLNEYEIDNMYDSFEEIMMNIDLVSSPIKKLLDKSISHFSFKSKIIYNSLYDSNNLSGLEQWEYLHPNLRNLFLSDISIKEEEKQGKIDIYIDISGSMSGSLGINSITKHTFAKSFLFKLFKKDILKDIYTFNNKVELLEKNLFNILTLKISGGTDINEVVKNIEITKNNSIIITDAEDSCSIYSPYCFFIGIKGSSFNLFSKNVINEYKKNNQIIIFDGTKIKYVK